MAKKSRKSPARGSKAKAKDTGFEVEDQEEVEAVEGGASAAGIETGLVFVTFVALIVGFVLAQIDLSSNYGEGWIF